MKKLVVAIFSAICLIAIATTPTLKVNSPTLVTGANVFNDLTSRGSVIRQ